MKSFCSKMKNNHNNLGFTLIELLIVISVIGVLAGVLMTVVNQQRQREHAEDAVSRQNLSQVAQAIVTFRTAEGFYPDQGFSQNPESGSDSTVLRNYLTEWPSGFVYNEDGADFSIHVRMPSSIDYFKYSSDWHYVRECADGTDPTSVDDCD